MQVRLPDKSVPPGKPSYRVVPGVVRGAGPHGGVFVDFDRKFNGATYCLASSAELAPVGVL